MSRRGPGPVPGTRPCAILSRDAEVCSPSRVPGEGRRAPTPVPPDRRHAIPDGPPPGRRRRPACPVIDTHLHCFAGKDDPRFPYHPQGPYQPAEPATPEHLLRCMAEAGVDYAVVVHPEPYQDDHRYLEHCLDVGKGKLKGTCLFFADRPGSLDRMTELVKRTRGGSSPPASTPTPPTGCRRSASRSCGRSGSRPATWAWRCSSTSSPATPPASSR